MATIAPGAARGAPVAYGAGRMGRGIAIAFAYAGHAIALVDSRRRDAAASARLRDEAFAEIRQSLDSLARLGAMDAGAVDAIAARVQWVDGADAPAALAGAEMVYEGVPETLDAKRDALAEIGRHCRADAVLTSTTSSILVTQLAPLVARPERFLNLHWLNPAYLIPVVELSTHPATSADAIERTRAAMTGIGKLPVVCGVAARLHRAAAAGAGDERGGADGRGRRRHRRGDRPRDALRPGLRFAAIGVVEFIDFGGADILHHASREMARSIDAARYAAPPVIGRMMEEGRLGLKTGSGSTTTPGATSPRIGATSSREPGAGARRRPVASPGEGDAGVTALRAVNRRCAAPMPTWRRARCTTPRAATARRRRADRAAAPDAAQLARVRRGAAAARCASARDRDRQRRVRRVGPGAGAFDRVVGRGGAAAARRDRHRARARRRPPHRRRDRGRDRGARAGASGIARALVDAVHERGVPACARRPAAIDAVAPSDDGSHLAALWQKRQAFYPPGRPDLLQSFVADALKVGGDVEAGHRACASYRMEDRIGAVRAPVLIVQASDDPFARAPSRRVASRLAGSGGEDDRWRRAAARRAPARVRRRGARLRRRAAVNAAPRRDADAVVRGTRAGA
jgi:3-hydroxybutyryl-CoA dehydrogenase